MLDVSSLKHWAKELVTILRTAIENNLNNPPIQQNNRLRLADNNPTNRNQVSPGPTLASSSCIWPS